MNVARILAVVLIAVEAAALALGSAVFIPILVTAAAIASLFVRWRAPISRRAGLWLALLGGLGVQAALSLLDAMRADSARMPQVGAVQDIGCCLLAVQAAMLFVKREGDRPNVVLPGVGILVFLSAGLQSMEGWRADVFRILAVGFVTLAGIVFIQLRPAHSHGAVTRRIWWRRATIGSLLVTLGLVSWAGGDVFGEALDEFWKNVSTSARSYKSKFSGSGNLSAISSLRFELSDEVQIRVQSTTRPGYLRGQAFSYFDGFGWEELSHAEMLRPMSDWPAALPVSRQSGNLFGREAPTAGAWRHYTCQPTNPEGWIFVPLNTTHVITPTRSIEINSHDVFTMGRLRKGESYTALVPFTDEISELSGRRRFRLMGVPRMLDRELDDLVESALAGCTTAGDKIAAVERYFRANYEYQLENTWIAEEENAILYFLRERPPAHCEFFATGAAMLLRHAGVPCRYVTGYVAVEPDKVRGHWLARGRHAHAWVEAYDDEKGWVVVEATPTSGVPAADQSASAIGVETSEWWSVWLSSFPWLWAATVGVILVACVGLLIVIPKAIQRLKARKRFLALQRDPLFSSLHELLINMDRYVHRFQLERKPSETLHNFAQRIRQRARLETHLIEIAQWYPIYAACRYDGDFNEETIAVLNERLHAAQRRAKQ